MKKLFEKVIAGVLAIVVAFQFQVPTFAASEEKQYVSDVYVSYGEGDAAESDAKAWLTDNGYTVVDTNLNDGAESKTSSAALSWATGARSARAVYLGYKTTTDVNEAITSLKTMNMTGSYSFDSYQEVLDQMKDEINAFMDQLLITLKEWRENYNAGRGKAIEAYNLLNMLYDPDCENKGMGDLLLNETKEELGDSAYMNLSDEEKTAHADLTTILMEGNADAIKCIEQLLAMGADTDKDSTWLDRMTTMGTYDDMLDSLEKEAEEKNETFMPSEAASQLSAKYDSAARDLAVGITELQKLFTEYVNSGTSLRDDENKIANYVSKSSNSSSFTAEQWLSMGTLYEGLSAYKYPTAENPDGTLQDFFMQTFDPDDADSRALLYPMAAALSDGQRAATSFVAVSELITQGMLTDDEALNASKDYKAGDGGVGSASVFQGVDRSVFYSSSTALTSSARELQSSSQKSYTEGLLGVNFSLQTMITAGIFAVSLIASISCKLIANSLGSQLGPMTAFEQLEHNTILDFTMNGNTAQQAIDYTKEMVQKAASLDAEGMEFISGYAGAVDYMAEPELYNHKGVLFEGFKKASAILAIVTVAMGIWTVCSGLSDLRAYYNRDMDLYPIPANMVDENQTEDGSMVYTYYKAVQSNRVEKGLTKGRSVLEDNADLNGDLGKEWLALYYTKDKSAGNPLTVSDVSGFTVVKGGESTPEGMTALTLFDQENPVNLTNEDWVWNDKTGGLYLYYTVSSTATAASVFSGVSEWVLYVGAGVIIAAIFFVVGMTVGRRRKRDGDAAAEA